jgi:peptidoglycan/xylan/chitin deacetylase (PgdA/CDA1 family)
MNFKPHIKKAITHSGLLSLAARFVPARIAILRYHSVQDEPERHANSIGSGIIHATDVFEKQMRTVASEFDPITLDDVLLFLNGEKPTPRRPVAITFDDGYVDNLEIAVPILGRFGIKASFYVTVEPVENGRPPWFCRLRHAFGTTHRRTWHDSTESRVHNIVEAADRKSAFLVASGRCARHAGEAQDQTLSTIEKELEVEPLTEKLMMTWDQVRTLQRSGHIVGSHTLTHPNMACMGLKDLHKECVESKNTLERELGVPVHHFSYPSPILQPHWNKQTMEITATAGYRSSVTSTAGPVRKGDHPLSLRRVVVPSDIEEFVWLLESTLLGRRM